jgi:hypothetical protein
LILCDVSVLVSAGMPESPHHAACRAAVKRATAGQDPLAVSDLILAAVVRIATNPRIWRKPASTASAFGFVGALRAHARAVAVEPGPRHWRIFEDLATGLAIRGGDLTDAYLAALALEHGCEWWTIDAGFARFPGLRWRNLLAP